MSAIWSVVQIMAIPGAILGYGFVLAWYLDVIEVCWWPELSDLKNWCRSLKHDNEYLVKEHARVVRENHHLRGLVRIDAVAQQTTRAMLQVATEERHTIECRVRDR